MTRSEKLSLVIVVLFAVFTAVVFRDRPGSDLSSSYLGCRVFVTGQTQHLYGQDAVNYDVVSDPIWRQEAIKRGFPADANLPPYVQTPLWGYVLQPLCRTMMFPAFDKLFVALLSLCFAGTIWLVVRRWAPRLLHPAWMALICVVFSVTDTMRYSMQLSQTHIIFILLALIAVFWARTGHPLWAGALLALAAAVKITPGLIFIYWLMTRQGRAALSFVVSSVVLMLATVALTGPSLVVDYFHNMARISNMLLVAFNNQSLAATWMSHAYPASETAFWHILPLPHLVKLASLGLMLASAVLGGYTDWKLMKRDPSAPPYGAVLTLIGGTMFTPIAWSHYFIILLIPILFLLDETVRRRALWAPLLAAAIFFLSMYSVLWRRLHVHAPFLPEFMRNQFYAGILTLAALLLLYSYRMKIADRRLEPLRP